VLLYCRTGRLLKQTVLPILLGHSKQSALLIVTEESHVCIYISCRGTLNLLIFAFENSKAYYLIFILSNSKVLCFILVLMLKYSVHYVSVTAD